MRSPILVAVDFTAIGRAAFDHALAHARARQADLVAVHAVPADEPFRWRGRERHRLFDRLRRTAEGAGVDVELRVQQGDPAGIILLHARADEPQLIVLGTQPRSWIERLRAHSVAERVIQSAARPVLIVPAATAAGASGRGLDRVVAAIDFRTASNRALDEALMLASEAAGSVTMVHVVPQSGSAELSGAGHRIGILEYHDLLLHRDAWRGMEQVRAARPGVAGQLRAVVTSGRPARVLARIAREADAGLIVVGVTARGPIGRWLFGTTAARLMRIADRPVLAVPERARRHDLRLPGAADDRLAA